MNNHKVNMFILMTSLCMILSACSSTPIAPSEMDMMAKNLKSPQDKALLYIYQHDWGHGRSNVSVMLDDDDRFMGKVDNYTYVVWLVNPGSHKIAVMEKDLGSKIMPIDIKAGQTYYIEQWFPRLFTNMIDLKVVDKLVGLEAIKECKLTMYEGIASVLKTGEVKEKVLDAVIIFSHIKSDVDKLPTLKNKSNKNAYAIVIGIENYRQKLPMADFATQDALLVADYLVKVMGYPEENVVTLLNDRATNVDLAKYFEKWLPNNVEKGSAVFVYYSGHGAPNPRTGDAYLVPYDGDPSFIDQTGYSLKRMYEALGKLPAKEIIVALDSCFSGAGGRSVLAEGARPLVMNLQTSFALSGNIKVMAAASGDQISSTYKDKGHGLFTYFMLKGIKNEDVVKPDGSIAVNALFSYVKPQVERIARKQYNNEQTPQLIEAKKN